ncbi:MAG: site-specific integrase, partial [Verrucomicrobiota bacterium]
EAVSCKINQITGAEVANFLRSLKQNPRSRNNIRDSVSNLIGFAQSRGYIPKDFIDLDALPKAKVFPGEIRVFTPDELSKLLIAAEDKFVPFLAIGAFAGLRAEEILDLDWADLDIEEGFIKVSARSAKTSWRRLALRTTGRSTFLSPLFALRRLNGLRLPMR